jgi:hypothetical protein
MSRTRRLLVAALLISVVLGIAVVGYAARSAPSKNDQITTARQWARLDPLPAGATDVQVQSTGGTFTRGFVITFDAEPGEIEGWLRSSPGIADAVVEVTDGSQHYAIKPHKAQLAEVTVKGKRFVTIRTYWS